MACEPKKHGGAAGCKKGYAAREVPSSARASAEPPLTSCPLFAGLDAQVLRELETHVVRKTLAPGDLVLREGEPAEHLFVLLRGVVRVLLSDRSGLQITVKLFTAPAVFGEMEALTGTRFIETVEVVRRAQLVAIERHAMERMLSRHAELSRRLLVDVCHRFRTSAVNQGYIAFKQVDRRLANLLYSYCSTVGTQVKGGTEIVAEDLSHAALARGIAATERSVQRVFQKWKELNLVSRRGRYYVVHDVAQLAALAGEDAPQYAHSMR